MAINRQKILLKGLLLSVLILCFSKTVWSQKRISQENLPAFDNKLYHFGFILGLNTSDFYLNYNPGVIDTLLILESQKQNGFNLGIVSALHLAPNFSLRFLPSLAFGQRNLEYSFLKPDSTIEFISKPIESTYLEFPLLLKYRSDRYNNYAAYLIAGGKYSWDLAAQQDVNNANNAAQDIVIPTKKSNYMAEIGFGNDFFLEYFKFGLEIKYSHGLNNVFINDGTRYSAPIESLRSKIILVSILFEG